MFAGGGEERSPDLHVGILLDLSGSMAGRLPLLRDTTIEVLHRLPEAIDYVVVEVGNDARLSRFARGEFSALVERVRHLRRNERTSERGRAITPPNLRDSPPILVFAAT